MLYLPVMYVLITNHFVTRRQYRRVFALAVVAISIQSVFALVYYRSLPAVERGLLESLTDHPASVTMNAVFLVLVCLLAFGGSKFYIWIVAVLTLPVAYAYLLSQRRAAMVAFFIGVLALLGVLFVRRKRLFWIITPTMIVLGLGFLAVTWNAAGAPGLPATAVKTVMFPDQLNEVDQASSEYRDLEAYNLWFTIRGDPLSGIGFGQPFTVVRPMPDISFFEYWQYLPHNSVLWIWIKTGFFGFVTMLFLFGRALQHGARTALRVASPNDGAMVVVGFSYVVMFLVFAYVDIGWVARNTVFLALAFGLCADFEQARADEEVTSGTAVPMRLPVPA